MQFKGHPWSSCTHFCCLKLFTGLLGMFYTHLAHFLITYYIFLQFLLVSSLFRYFGGSFVTLSVAWLSRCQISQNKWKYLCGCMCRVHMSKSCKGFSSLAQYDSVFAWHKQKGKSYLFVFGTVFDPSFGWKNVCLEGTSGNDLVLCVCVVLCKKFITVYLWPKMF